MARRSNRTALLAVTVTLLAVLGLGALGGASAWALSPAPGWEVSTENYPTNLAPGAHGVIEIDVFDIGALAPQGKITVTDVLPAGLTATEAGEFQTGTEVRGGRGIGVGVKQTGSYWHCSGVTSVTCTLEPSGQFPFPIANGGAGGGGPLRIAIAVNVAAGASGAPLNHVTVVGGGAPTPASAEQPVRLSATEAPFGFPNFDVWFSNADGTVDTQAGSHPYTATFAFNMATDLEGGEEGEIVNAGGDVDGIVVKLPPGFVGDPTAVPQCTRQQLNAGGPSNPLGCPAASQVGIATIGYNGGIFNNRFEVFNMVPPPGVPAEFGFNFGGIVTFLDATVRSGSDYGISTNVPDVAQRGIASSVVTLWGYPADHTHDAWRNSGILGCTGGGGGGYGNCEPIAVGGGTRRPFLTLPTSCTGPLPFSISAGTWQHPSDRSGTSFLSHDSNDNPTGLSGCDQLDFGPSLSVAPDTAQADTPTGLTVEVKPPVGGLSEVEGLSTANIQNTTVTLPEGLVINPGQAAGLLACQPSEDALGPLPNGEEDDGPPSCPSASKVGTVSIATPILPNKLEGNVYVLQSNPPDLKLLVAASGEGVNLKLVGDVHLDATTGRLTTTFAGTPELPFTDFKLSFSGGAQAALATPSVCGVYTTDADFDSWASPFIADAFLETSFAIEGGPNGSPCPSAPRAFTPSLTAGATTDQAGGYTDFSLLLQRADAQQRVSTLQFKTPEGLLGMISRVPLCGEPQAAQGTCTAASQIGHTVVASGPGPFPLVVPQPGQPPAAIYLTGGYRGAPYGLSIVVPLVVGPFTLQTQVVRARIEVDPHTAQLTITTDPLPAIVDGIPTDLRTVNAVIDRPGFMFNPTDCKEMAFSGSATSTEGAVAPISSHFQVGSCQSLKFAPYFKVSTAGKTSRRNGASLDAKIVYPTGALGANQASSQSNIASVKVDLPKQLPSRLTTLQKACTAAVFDTNPATCPKASVVGHARVLTPVLPVPLTGPAYFVSHGGEAFPQLIVVLQGYGVTVDLVGDTFISRAGITSSTFRQVPDVPISSFELTLPQGPLSALAANLPAKAKGNFCGQKLTMPTAFTGHNGAVIHESIKITTTGCAKPQAKRKRSAKAKRSAMAKKDPRPRTGSVRGR